jgi:hypothetical protein
MSAPAKALQRSNDRWTIVPAIGCTVGLWLWLLVAQMPGSIGFMVALATILVIPVGLIVALCFAVVFAAKSRPLRAGSALLAIIVPALLWAPMVWISDYAHLALTIGLGTGQIGSSATSNQGGFTTYDWSVGFAGGPNTFLIHDPTDEIALPLKLHKHPISSEMGFGEDCAGKVRHLIAHYYVCTF